jgi:hypothetical protein
MNQSSDPRDEQRLAPSAESAGLDRAVREDLEKLRVEAMLDRQEATADLARAIEESVRAPLAVAEIAATLNRLESPALAELEGLLAGPEAAGLQMEKQMLAELLQEGAEGKAILKRGLVFVKHRRYAEALEWWTLQRRSLDAANSRLHLLLLILESLTYFWSGDHERAAATRAQVRDHKLFRTLYGGLDRGQGPAGK